MLLRDLGRSKSLTQTKATKWLIQTVVTTWPIANKDHDPSLLPSSHNVKIHLSLFTETIPA
jgi:hypothetical protein